jgi:hypothetical protein
MMDRNMGICGGARSPALSCPRSWVCSNKLMKHRRDFGLPIVLAGFTLLAAPGCEAFAQNQRPVENGTNGLLPARQARGRGLLGQIRSTRPMTGSITVETAEMGHRWSHVQNTDGINVCQFQLWRGSI